MFLAFQIHNNEQRLRSKIFSKKNPLAL